MKKPLNIALLESDIVWNDKKANINIVSEYLCGLKGADILVLPEMFATGFTFETLLAEPDDGYIMTCVRKLSAESGVAICGTFLASENGKYYNRCFFVTPEGGYYKYDKRHLFCLSKEAVELTAGTDNVIVDYYGWKIALFICYDLRFPVWMRNKNLKYDIAIIPANWPEVRNFAWASLLVARAIENQAYVVAVNRTGRDADNLKFVGNSNVLDFKGNSVLHECNGTKTAVLDYDKLSLFRNKYQFWKDAD